MSFPRWVTSVGGHRNLREVAPNLYVGSELSPSVSVGAPWELVVSFCGRVAENRSRYTGAKAIVSAEFADGDSIPGEYLDKVVPRVLELLEQGPVLLHCAAGLSRSASAAYAVLRIGFRLSDAEALSRVQVEGHAHQYPMPMTLFSARAWVQQRQQKTRSFLP